MMKKKQINIEGMHCPHCSLRIENALNALPSVKAKVNLKKQLAKVSCDESVSDDQLRTTIEDLGFKVISVE